MKRWRAMLVAGAICATLMGGQAAIFGGASVFAAAGLGMLIGSTLIVYVLGAEGLLWSRSPTDDRP